MHSPLALIYCPFPDELAARHAAEQLLNDKLIACANILPAGLSLFPWQGVMTEASESILLVKTSATLAENATARLAAIHPYEIPAVLTLQATANAAYAQWVEEMTAGAASVLSDH